MMSPRRQGIDSSLLEQFADSVAWTGDIRSDVVAFLQHHGRHDTAHHCIRVGARARALAERFDVVPARAEFGGWLHDISAAVPRAQYLAVAQAWGVDVLLEERQRPMLLHQKLSVVIAREVFHVTDEGVLSAIGCHTTLKMGMLPVDKVVFLADKIEWDQPNTPPYIDDMEAVLYGMPSLDAAIRVYCDYVWEHRDGQFVAHPWFVDVSQSMEQV
jgi:predicted HD superfamily hydrolase involved in NAD metabolism